MCRYCRRDLHALCTGSCECDEALECAGTTEAQKRYFREHGLIPANHPLAKK